MRFRNTLLALIVLAVLAGIIYYYEYRGEDERRAAEEAEKNALTFEREKVKGIEIVRTGAPPISLKKESGAWVVAAPLQTRADQEKVESLLSSLSWLRVEQRLKDVTEPELEGFKLKEPAGRITLELEEGKEPAVLRIGDKAAVGGNYYAAVPGSPEVLLVSSGVEQVLGSSLDALRYKKVVGLDAWKVARFRIEKRDGGAVAFGRDEGEDAWRLVSPIAFPADASKVQGLWFDMQSLEAEGFETESPSELDLEKLGLDRPAVTLTVEAKEGAAPIIVAFGVPSGDSSPSDAAYARRSDMGAVMKVKRETLDKLGAAVSGLQEYRDSRAAPVDRFRLAGIEIQRAGGAVTLVKDEEASKWHWEKKDGPEMPSEEVNNLIDAIEGLKATEFIDSPGAGGEPPPALAITVREGGDEKGRSVTVKVAPAGGASGRRVISTASSSIYIVPEAAAETLVDRADGIKAPGDKPAEAAEPTGEPAEEVK